jgi:hypothetical protein
VAKNHQLYQKRFLCNRKRGSLKHPGANSTEKDFYKIITPLYDEIKAA